MPTKSALHPKGALDFPDSTKYKSITQRIIRVNQKLVATGDVGGPLHFRDDGRVGAESGRFDHSSGEAPADDTLNDNRLIETYFSARMV